VIPGLPEGLEVSSFCNRCVWHENNEWRQIIGSGIVEQGGTCFLHRSCSLLEWEYLGLLWFGWLREARGEIAQLNAG